MYIIFGRYRFGEKRVGVRKDFCNYCEDERLTERRRTLDFGHLYWIPLVPLGLYWHWHCATCGRDPRARYRTSYKALKIIAAVAVGIIFLATFLITEEKGEALIAWGFRTALLLCFLGLLYWIINGKNKVDLLNQAKRDAVIPLSERECIYCNGELINDATLCPAFEVHVYR